MTFETTVLSSTSKVWQSVKKAATRQAWIKLKKDELHVVQMRESGVKIDRHGILHMRKIN